MSAKFLVQLLQECRCAGTINDVLARLAVHTGSAFVLQHQPPRGCQHVEACSQYHSRLVANLRSHPLIATLHTAFADTAAVCLSPDIIWLTLMQGVANHVNANAGQLRRHFVRLSCGMRAR